MLVLLYLLASLACYVIQLVTRRRHYLTNYRNMVPCRLISSDLEPLYHNDHSIMSGLMTPESTEHNMILTKC